MNEQGTIKRHADAEPCANEGQDVGRGGMVREVGCRDAQALEFKRALMTVILSAKILNL